MSIVLPGNFLRAAWALKFDDTASATWSFDKTTNTLTLNAVFGGVVADDSITNAKLANMAQSTIKGRASGAGTGDPTDLTASQVKTILALTSADISDFTEAAQDAALSVGTDTATIDITYSDAGNSWSASIITDSIDNTFLANMSQSTIKGRASGAGTGDPTDLTAAQVKTILALAHADLSDYTATTWTAVVQGSGTAGTYEIASQRCTYTRLGNRIILDFDIVLAGSITGGGTGDLNITGLPVQKVTSSLPVGTSMFSGVDFTATYVNSGFPTSNASSTLCFYCTNDNAAIGTVPISGVAAGDRISGSICYPV